MRLKKLRESLMDGDAGAVFKGMATLLMGSGVAKLIGLASTPLLTRLYSPEDFGVLSIYVALVSFLTPLLTLRYVLAIPLPKTDALAANIAALSSGVLSVMALLLSLLLWRAGEYFLNLMSMDALIPWRWMIVVGVVGAAIYEVLSMWATRKKDYRILAKTQFSQSVLGASIKLLLGVLALKPLGLLLGQIAAQSAGIGTYLRHYWCDINRHAANVNCAKVMLVARHYISYPLFRLPSQILLVFSTQAPLLLVATFYGSQITGQLGLALMALALPVNLLGESMSKSFYAEIADIGRKKPDIVRRLTYLVTRRLFWLSILPALLLMVGGKWIFSKIFGHQWGMAGEFASVLAFYLVFQFVQKPVSYLMFVFDGQKELLYLSIQRAAATVLCFWVGRWVGLDAVATVAVYSFVLSLHYVFSIFLAVKKIPKVIPTTFK